MYDITDITAVRLQLLFGFVVIGNGALVFDIDAVTLVLELGQLVLQVGYRLVVLKLIERVLEHVFRVLTVHAITRMRQCQHKYCPSYRAVHTHQVEQHVVGQVEG